MLGSWGMVRCEVTGDGNCIFSAIATFLLNKKDSLILKKSDFFPQALLTRNIRYTNYGRKNKRACGSTMSRTMKNV